MDTVLLVASLAPPATAADVHTLGPGWRPYARHGAFAAPGAHDRVGDLDVSTGAGAKTVGWTVPWVTPITDVAIVRSVEGAPSGVEDGDVVAHLRPAAPGAPMSWTDEDPPASDVYYAVFPASEPGA